MCIGFELVKVSVLIFGQSGARARSYDIPRAINSGKRLRTTAAGTSMEA